MKFIRTVFSWRWFLLPLLILYPLAIIAAGGELTEVQVILIGLAAVGITQVIGWIVKAKGKKIGKRTLTFVVIGASGILSIVLRVPDLPPWNPDDFFGWLSAMLDVIDGIVFFATVIYNVLLHEVLKRAGDWVEKQTGFRVNG